MTIPADAVWSVRERDIDLLIIEELWADPNFQRWLAHRTHGADVGEIIFEDARCSVFDSQSQSDAIPMGETDVLFRFRNASGRRWASLIENKIDAPPQHEQDTRYLERGEKGIRDSEWDFFRTCLIAPSKYLTRYGSGKYQAKLCYEDLKIWFDRSIHDRAKWKSYLIDRAIRYYDKSIERHLRPCDSARRQLFFELSKTIKSINPAIEENIHSYGVAYRFRQNFVEMYFAKKRLRVCLRSCEYHDPLRMLEKTNNAWTLNMCMYIEREDQINAALLLITQSYKDVAGIGQRT